MLLTGACSSDPAGTDSGTETDAGTTTGEPGSTSGVATDGGSSTGGSTGGGSTCPLGDKTFKFSLEVPAADPPLDPNNDTDARIATCAVDDVSVAGQEMTASMTCSEGALAGQAYVLKLTLPEGESVALSTGDTAQVRYTHWWGDYPDPVGDSPNMGVGEGERLAVQVGDNVVLALYVDSVGGGVAGNCLAPGDLPRAGAQVWLSAFMGTIADTDCDDLGTVAVDFSGNAILPGESTNVPVDMQSAMNALLGKGSCFVPDGTAEEWSLEFVAWVPG